MSASGDSADFFPVPSSPSSDLIPAVWPGVTPESTKALHQVLIDNHQRWHIFFNEKGFHNHSAHRALAIWSVGASADVIKAGYRLDCNQQVEQIDPPTEINDANFKEHLSESEFYHSYLVFFTDKVRQNGVAPVVEKYVFSKEYNYDASQKKHPRMLDRFLGGLIHPMIHVGYGLEFCLPGMVAEGLAQAAVHRDSAHAGIPEEFFDSSQSHEAPDSTATRLKDMILSSDSTTTDKPANSSSWHAFTILARVLQNPEFGKMVDLEGIDMYTAAMERYGGELAELVKNWHLDPTNPKAVEEGIEELSWMNALIYGIGGWKEGQEFNADFFHMHMVTSSLFLPSFAAYLSRASQALLLRSYLLTSLIWWVSRGRAKFDIKGFYAHTGAYLTHTTTTARHVPALPTLTDMDAAAPNPWFAILDASMVHPDDHLTKLQRALAHYSRVYGTREKGAGDFSGTALEGAEELDGTLFVRVAALTADRMAKVKEGDEGVKWDRSGFYQA